MAYKLETSKLVDKFLDKHKDLAQKIIEKLEILAQNPYTNALDIVKLSGYDKHYRLRIGKYRLLYEVIDEQILIYAYDIDSRGDIYKD